jgi:hypothetical protein
MVPDNTVAAVSDDSTDETTHTSSPTTGRAIATPADYAGSVRDRTNRQLDRGDLTTIDADQPFQIANFCESRNCWPVIVTCERDWYGFGTVRPLFVNDADDDFWMNLTDILRVSGMGHDDLYAMFLDDLEEDTGDVAELEWLVNDEGGKQYLPLAGRSFAMRAMLEGPWSKEFIDNTRGLLRRALVNSGMADAFGPVVVIDEHGNTTTEASLADVLTAAGLPTKEEAAEQAFRGPLGGVL